MRRLLALLVALCLPATAFARPDPNGDRLGLMPTALTLQQGEAVFNNYELFFVQGSYGVTDSLQLSAGGMVPLTTEFLLGQLSAKLRLVDQGPLKVALAGNTFFVTTGGGTAGTLSATPVVTYCLDGLDCESVVNLALSASWLFGTEVGVLTEGFLLSGGAGILYKVGSSVKLIGELSFLGAAANGDFVLAQGTLLTYGVRFFSDNLAGDVGFVKPFSADMGGDIFPLGIPAVNFSYRW